MRSQLKSVVAASLCRGVSTVLLLRNTAAQRRGYNGARYLFSRQDIVALKLEVF